MRDEMDMRMWNAHHADFSAGIDHLMAAFRTLVAIQYYAPWNKPKKECRS